MRLRSSAVCLLVLLSACRRAYGEPSTAVIDPRHTPEQTAVDPADRVPRFDDVVVTPKARYRIEARVVSRERYYFGERSSFSPLDLALGWAGMSDPSVDEYIKWHQGGRWYFYQWEAGSPYRTEQIQEESANVHIIPSNPNTKRVLLSLDRNDVILLEGFLVDVDTSDGEHYPTSLSRQDMGNAACEQMLVTAITVDGKAYR